MANTIGTKKKIVMPRTPAQSEPKALNTAPKAGGERGENFYVTHKRGNRMLCACPRYREAGQETFTYVGCPLPDAHPSEIEAVRLSLLPFGGDIAWLTPEELQEKEKAAAEAGLTFWNPLPESSMELLRERSTTNVLTLERLG